MEKRTSDIVWKSSSILRKQRFLATIFAFKTSWSRSTKFSITDYEFSFDDISITKKKQQTKNEQHQQKKKHFSVKDTAIINAWKSFTPVEHQQIQIYKYLYRSKSSTFRTFFFFPDFKHVDGFVCSSPCSESR